MEIAGTERCPETLIINPEEDEVLVMLLLFGVPAGIIGCISEVSP